MRQTVREKVRDGKKERRRDGKRGGVVREGRQGDMVEAEDAFIFIFSYSA